MNRGRRTSLALATLTLEEARVFLSSLRSLMKAARIQTPAAEGRKRGSEGSLMTEIGAGEGIRTLDPDLGKVVLYP